MFDIFAAIEAVYGHQSIDTAKIGLLGSSRGGFAIISAMMEQITQRFSLPGAKIVAGFAGYPWCGLQFWQPRLSPDAVLQIFSGDQDNWVSVQQCQDLVHALAQRENAAGIRILSGAFHAFDRTGFPPTELPEVPRTIRFPTVYMDDNGYFLDPATGLFRQDLNADFFDRQVLEGGFVERGVTVGSRDGDAQLYVSEMLEFFTRELKRVPRDGAAK